VSGRATPSKPVPARAWALGAVAAVAASAAVAWSSPLGIDYAGPDCAPEVCDDAAPSIEALAEGDLDGFFASQPPMGSFSLVLRTPPALIANALGGGGDLAAYRLGVFVCVLAAGLLAVLLAATMARRGRPWTAWALVPAACVVSPLTYQAAWYGHPEEVLGAALVVAAVLAAGSGRWLLAGLAIGCAVATKQWAALAVLPVLIAAPPGTRMRLAAAGTVALAALTVPLAAGDPGRFRAAQENVSVAAEYTNTITATNIWWPVASESSGRGLDHDGESAILTQYSLDPGFGRLARFIVIGLALALTLLYARRRAGASPEEVLQLVALLFLLRCMLDPLTFSYHHTPFLVALVSYEALRRRLPVLSAFAIGALLLMDEVVAPSGDPALINAAYLAWTLPLAATLAVSILAPARLRADGRRLGLDLEPPAARAVG
jgi:hypothetical protein